MLKLPLTVPIIHDIANSITDTSRRQVQARYEVPYIIVNGLNTVFEEADRYEVHNKDSTALEPLVEDIKRYNKYAEDTDGVYPIYFEMIFPDRLRRALDL